MESQALLLMKWNDPAHRGIYTAKIFEYLAAGRPVLAVGGYDDVVNEHSGTTSRTNERGISDVNIELGKSDWSKSTIKFSSHLAAQSRDIMLNAYMNYGKNIKFPTMFQQISLPANLVGADNITLEPDLSPELNSNAELGLDIVRELEDPQNIDGWQVSFNVFKNSFTNKFVMFYLPNNPIAFYNIVNSAEISGFELNGKVFLFQKKITFEAGSSVYSISDKAAFPFKSERKSIFNLLFEHAGFSLKLHYFNESDQEALVRDQVEPVTLPGYANLDVHLSKFFEISKIRFFANFSGRNLLDNDTELEGLAIRDRRYYLTLGVQY